MMGNMFASTKIMNFILPSKTGLVLVLGCWGLFNLLKKKIMDHQSLVNYCSLAKIGKFFIQ